MPLDHKSRTDNSIITVAAQRLGASSSAVYKYLAGMQYPTLQTVRKIEREFGWTVTEQIRLMPEENGVYDQGYGLVLMEVLREHFGDIIDDPDFPGPALPPRRERGRRPGHTGWTHAWVATVLNVKVANVTRWLNGQRYPESRTMLRIEKQWGWPAGEQIALLPIEGYNNDYGTAFRAVLDQAYPDPSKERS